jgi:hypothetical protein
MPDDFSILAGFLERFDEEVEGRALDEPAEDVQRQLMAFAGGTLAEAERAQVIQLLQAHPQWIPWLAQQVKALRQASQGGS